MAGMTPFIADVIVMSTSAFLILLGLACLWLPAHATKFLQGFATTARLHYIELLIRVIAGAAFLVHGPSSRFPTMFDTVAWVLLATTAIMLVVPWRQHRKFAIHAVSIAARFIRHLGAIAVAMGAALLFAA
jgi:hypothetical protein